MVPNVLGAESHNVLGECRLAITTVSSTRRDTSAQWPLSHAAAVVIAATSTAAATAAAAATVSSRALDSAATRAPACAAASCSAASRARSAAASLAASAAAACFASRSASSCASSSLLRRARASAPTPPSRTSRGAAASAASSADSPPPAMAARSAASARSAADAAGSGAAAGGGAEAAGGGASLGSSAAAAARPALFFFLDFFEGACALACSAACLGQQRLHRRVRPRRPRCVLCLRCLHGGGRLRRRGVLPDELRGGRVALGLGTLQGGKAAFEEQLGVGLGSQQRLHARLVPAESGPHQGGATEVGLQVGVGRKLQQDEQDGEVAHVHSMHERGARPRLVCRSMLAPRFSSSLTIARWPQAAAACSRVEAEGRPSAHVVGQSASTSAPLRSHLTTPSAARPAPPPGGSLREEGRESSSPLGAARSRWPHPRACRPSYAPAPGPALGAAGRVAQREAEQKPACNGGYKQRIFSSSHVIR